VTFYVNGVQSHDLGVNHLTVVPFTGLVGDSTDSLGVGAFVQDNANPPANSSQFFYGQIDEVRISNAALLPGQFLINQGNYTGPPVIIAQPQDVAVPVGLNPNFIVSAVGPGLNWQWSFNNTNISGATNYFCPLANVSSAAAGYYSVIISNAYGFTNSRNALLTVTARSWESGLAFNYSSNGRNMPYRLYLPINYNPATNYPLVIFLHGSGQSGSDNVGQVANFISGLITRTYSQYPAILVAPQLNAADGWGWENPNDLTLGILAQVKRNYSVDDRRIYLTGLSMGGFGTTDYAFFFPTLFAAIVPMSGAEYYLPYYYPPGQLPSIPTWLFHGSADTSVPVSYSEYYYIEVTGLSDISDIVFTQTNSANYGYPTAVSGSIRLTELMGQGHTIWGGIYGAPRATDLYDWMFSQTRPPSTFSFSVASLESGNFVVGGSCNVPFAAGCLLTSTNLQIPRSQWQPIATNWCDVNGELTFTNKINANVGQQFYLLQFQ
jgi:predicted esterase